MKATPIDTSPIPGWGVDADPENDPTYPMRSIAANDKGGMNWQRLSQQEPTVEVLCSIEPNNLSAVFGISTPSRGLSEVMRRRAFRYGEEEWAHRFMLMAADRIKVVEGLSCRISGEGESLPRRAYARRSSTIPQGLSRRSRLPGPS